MTAGFVIAGLLALAVIGAIAHGILIHGGNRTPWWEHADEEIDTLETTGEDEADR